LAKLTLATASGENMALLAIVEGAGGTLGGTYDEAVGNVVGVEPSEEL
jgi:hypothetical protein